MNLLCTSISFALLFHYTLASIPKSIKDHALPLKPEFVSLAKEMEKIKNYHPAFLPGTLSEGMIKELYGEIIEHCKQSTTCYRKFFPDCNLFRFCTKARETLLGQQFFASKSLGERHLPGELLASQFALFPFNVSAPVEKRAKNIELLRAPGHGMVIANTWHAGRVVSEGFETIVFLSFSSNYHPVSDTNEVAIHGYDGLLSLNLKSQAPKITCDQKTAESANFFLENDARFRRALFELFTALLSRRLRDQRIGALFSNLFPESKISRTHFDPSIWMVYEYPGGAVYQPNENIAILQVPASPSEAIQKNFYTAKDQCLLLPCIRDSQDAPLDLYVLNLTESQSNGPIDLIGSLFYSILKLFQSKPENILESSLQHL